MLSGMPQVNGSVIRDKRQRLGIKLGEFAKLAGVNYKTLANVESGHNGGGASMEFVYLVAAALGDDVDADDLLVKPRQKAA
jgi:transcriptional regulator with XRE-family HTH domain